jgi:signal transduction histidine kinase
MTRRQSAIIVAIALCVILVATAVSLNVGWIIVTSRQVLPLALGILSFALIIAGLIIYTVFLVREMWRNEQHDRFINAVTHELKTPITSIRLYLETLQTHDVSDDQRHEFHEIMLADADRLQRTVEQVLKAGAAGLRARVRTPAPVDMRTLVSECVDIARLRHHLAFEALTLSTAEAPAGLVVAGDADELRTVLANLLDNAVKYSLRTIRVMVDVAAPRPDLVRIRIRDHGVGIPRRQLRRIFRRFYRVQVPGLTVNGTGLGLYIVQSIVRRHRGRVFVESDGEGTGATFTLELPRFLRSRPIGDAW